MCFCGSLIRKKLNLISGKRNFVYELPHELQNDLKLRILENQKKKKKVSKLCGDIGLSPAAPAQVNFSQ